MKRADSALFTETEEATVLLSIVFINALLSTGRPPTSWISTLNSSKLYEFSAPHAPYFLLLCLQRRSVVNTDAALLKSTTQLKRCPGEEGPILLL